MKFKTMKVSNRCGPDWEDYEQWEKNNKEGYWEDFKEQWYKSNHPEIDFNTLEELEAWTLEQDQEDEYGQIIIDFKNKEIMFDDCWIE